MNVYLCFQVVVSGRLPTTAMPTTSRLSFTPSTQGWLPCLATRYGISRKTTHSKNYHQRYYIYKLMAIFISSRTKRSCFEWIRIVSCSPICFFARVQIQKLYLVFCKKVKKMIAVLEFIAIAQF